MHRICLWRTSGGCVIQDCRLGVQDMNGMATVKVMCTFQAHLWIPCAHFVERLQQTWIFISLSMAGLHRTSCVHMYLDAPWLIVNVYPSVWYISVDMDEEYRCVFTTLTVVCMNSECLYLCMHVQKAACLPLVNILLQGCLTGRYTDFSLCADARVLLCVRSRCPLAELQAAELGTGMGGVRVVKSVNYEMPLYPGQGF